jgi:hypothetical protein
LWTNLRNVNLAEDSRWVQSFHVALIKMLQVGEYSGRPVMKHEQQVISGWAITANAVSRGEGFSAGATGGT